MIINCIKLKNNIDIYLAVLCTFIFINSFYYLIDSLSIISIFRNTCICLSLYFLMLLLSRSRITKIFTAVVLLVFGFVMLSIVYYYDYFGLLPSISTFKLYKQGGDIGGYVLNLFSIKNCFLMLLLLISCIGLIISYPKKYNYRYNICFIILFMFFSLFSQAYNYYRVARGVDLNASFKFEPELSVQRNGYIAYLLQKYVTLSSITYGHNLENPLVTNEAFTVNMTGREKKKRGDFIIIQVESLDNALIDLKVNGEEVTPFLNQLKKEYIYCPNFYAQHSAGGSSDAEYSSITGLLPLADLAVFSLLDLNTLPSIAKILGRYGYSSYGMHSNNGAYWNRTGSYRTLGFKKFYDAKDFTGKAVGFRSLDDEFFTQTIPLIKKIAAESKNYLIYMITQTLHGPYIIETNKRFAKSDKFSSLKNKRVQNYFEKAHYTDMSIGKFITNLKEAELFKNTNIIIFGDHTSAIRAEEYDCKKNVSENIPLLIISADGKKGQIDTYSSHLDIAPTVLDIAGIDNSSLMLGRSIYRWSPDRLFPIVVGLKDYIIYPQRIEFIKKILNPNYQEAVNYSKSFFFKMSKERETLKNIFLYSTYIADSLGSVNDVIDTNSKEALYFSYSKGVRVFETDLFLSSSDKLFCYNGRVSLFDSKKVVKENELYYKTAKEFSKMLICEEYSTLDLDKIIEYAKQHKDCNFVLNLQDNFSKKLNIVKKELSKNIDVSERFIIQSDFSHLEEVEKCDIIKNVILDINDPIYFLEKQEQLGGKKNIIKAVKVDKENFSVELAEAARELKIPLFVRKSNNQQEIYYYNGKYAFGFFSDITSELTNVLK